MTDLVKAEITTVDKGYIRSSVDISRPASQTVVLRGTFKHQGIVSDYAVYTSVSADKPITQDGEHACLSALATVISSTPKEQPVRVNVINGDIVKVDGKLYQIRDDRALSDPRLVEIGNLGDVVAADFADPAPEEVENPGEMLFESDPWRPDNNGTDGDVYEQNDDGTQGPRILGAGTIRGGEVNWATDEIDSNVEIYGGAVDLQEATMTFWHNGFQYDEAGVNHSVYAVNVTLEDGTQWTEEDIVAPDDSIDVDAARRAIAAMLLAETHLPTGKWPNSLVTWAVSNVEELSKVAVS